MEATQQQTNMTEQITILNLEVKHNLSYSSDRVFVNRDDGEAETKQQKRHHRTTPDSAHSHCPLDLRLVVFRKSQVRQNMVLLTMNSLYSTNAIRNRVVDVLTRCATTSHLRDAS